MPWGTLINTAAVLVGSLLGLLLHRRYPQRIKEIVFQGIGLFTLIIGMSMALKAANFLQLVFSILLGGILGEGLRLDQRIESLGERLKKLFRSQNSRFIDGLVTAFLLFCVGSMTIIGAIDEGLRGDRTLLLTKSLMDGFSSIALASTFGGGVAVSALFLFLFQSSITLLAGYLENVFTSFMLMQITAIGGALILGIGINLLELRSLRVINLLPSLLIGVILALIFPG